MILWSIIVSAYIIFLFRTPLFFVLGNFAFMTSIGAIRYWGKHMGIEDGKESNTHWFPLGMGIGNHEAHHFFPNLSWLTLTIGSFYRKKILIHGKLFTEFSMINVFIITNDRNN